MELHLVKMYYKKHCNYSNQACNGPFFTSTGKSVLV